MKYFVDKQERFYILRLEEDNLNSLIAPDLKSLFLILSNEGITNLILDLSHVKFVDSSGLSAILTAHRIWKVLGSFVLTGINEPSVKKLIVISKLEPVLTIIPTVEEAIDYIMMEEIQREIDPEHVGEDHSDWDEGEDD